MRLSLFAAVIAAVWLVLGAGCLTASAQDDVNLYLPIVTHDYTPGWHWGDAYTVTVAVKTGAPPLAAIDRAGRPHLFWHDASLDNQVHHTYLADDGWRAAIPSAGSDGDSALALAPLVDGAGALHLIWSNRLDTDELPNRYLHATFDGDSWSQPEQVFRFLYPTTKAWLRLDAPDRPRLGVVTGFLGGRGVVLQGGSGGWQSIADFSMPTAASIVWPDAANGAHLFGSSSSTLQYWRWLNGGASAAQTLGSGRLTGRSILFDSSDNLHMVWKAFVSTRAPSATLLHHQCIDNQRVLSAVSYLGGPESVREIAAAGEHGPLFALAWQEAARKRVMFWNGCAPGSVATIPETQSPAAILRAVAVSSEPRTVCVFLQQGETAVYTVQCATLDD